MIYINLELKAIRLGLKCGTLNSKVQILRRWCIDIYLVTLIYFNLCGLPEK